MAGKKTITLQSSDGETFDVDQAVAEMSQTIKNLMEDCPSSTVSLPNVTGSILAKVIEYCKMHHGKTSRRKLKAWDDEFVSDNMFIRFDLIMAANYLDITSLLDLCCQSVADFLKDLSPEEIREKFNIKNDFTPEEERKIREEVKWAFE